MQNQQQNKEKTYTKNGSIINAEQLECVVEKVWGHEEWIVNKPAYCGKKLVFKKSYQCSMHHHKIKDETFYLQSGSIILETEYDGQKQKRIMMAGDVAHITPNMWHRIIAITNAEIIEFSTFHREDDSYRRTESGKASLSALKTC